MPKVEYLGIKFDSELEVEYYKHLQELYKNHEIEDFNYHPDSIPNLAGKRSYTPDFIVLYKDRIEIVETKGYNPYSKMIDDQIHNIMLSKSPEWLSGYIIGNLANHVIRFAPTFEKWEVLAINKKVVYKKIKYLKAYGFVDWDFKNPNTLANKRKEKINDLSAELKELKEFKKNALRYWNYKFKQACKEKLTKKQEEWLECYGCDMIEELRKARKEQANGL